MRSNWVVILSILVSLVGIPAYVWYTLTAPNPPQSGSTEFVVLSSVVMVPGLLLGTTALWVIATS